MSTCPKCSTRLIRPPAVYSLRIHFPALIVDTNLDRSQLKCQHCDEMLAHRLATEAELPPPIYINPIAKLERAIWKIQDLIREDIEDEEHKSILKSLVDEMRLKWATLVKERDAKLKEAWMPYWAVWGVTKGQDVYAKS